MKLLFKNTFKKIFNSIGRFLSIMFIIALGISVFIGLREFSASMLYTADNYYDKYNLMDYKIISSYGLTKGDAQSIREITNAGKVIPSYSIDVLSEGKSIRIHALEKDVNNVEIIQGRMPKKNTECLADVYNYSVGDKIDFDAKDITKYININKCTVVGTIKSPLYIRDEKGISNVGNGKLISFIFVNKEVFVSEYYTEIYVIAQNTKQMNSYYEDYQNELTLLNEELVKLKPIRETIRYEEILKEANNKIVDIRKEVNEKLSDASKKLKNSKNSLDDSQGKLNDEKSLVKSQFENQYKILNDNKSNILNVLKEYELTESNITDYLTSLNNTINNLNNQLSSYEKTSSEYIELKTQIDNLKMVYNTLLELKNNLEEINNGVDRLDKEYASFQKTIADNQLKIDDGYDQYNKGISELKKSENEADQKINDAKKEISEIEKPKWYLLDRTDNSGYINYKEDIIKVDAIARVLPIFFILVGMLMSSNALSRLIEEERMEIGILEAIGYSKSKIIMGYLIYVFIAGILGLTIGLTIGYSIIPKIIYGVFLSRYYVPKLITIVSPLPFSLVIGVTMILAVVVTVIACYKELKEVPSNLLRPKPPKSGKKVFLENIKFIWDKLNFMWKITIRNLFRYKKRIIMTVLGVAGCTALLLTGMGLNDSINTISKLQYEDIFKYDSMFILDEKEIELSEYLINIFDDNNIKNPLLINQNAYTYNYDDKTGDVYVVISSDDDKLYNFINMTSSITNKKTRLKNDGVIITKQLSEQLNAGKGDIISIRNSDNELYFLHVNDVVKNYVSHYIYINKEYYNEIFGRDIKYNTIIAEGKIDGYMPLTEHNILMVSYTDDIAYTFESFVSGLNKIIILILVCAGMLAFVVLYNLTIINVSERKREIATLKVLGFNNSEVSAFIYRESIVLTLMGIIAGLILGVFLHRFVMMTAQTDNIMFLKEIKWVSFILSGVTTIVFSFIVQLIINRALRRIDMVESLKSVE